MPRILGFSSKTSDSGTEAPVFEALCCTKVYENPIDKTAYFGYNMPVLYVGVRNQANGSEPL